MSLETIKIRRLIPIINGHLQVPDNLEKNKNALPLETVLSGSQAVDGVSVIKLEAGTGGARLAGGKHGVQEMLALPEVGVSESDAAYEEIKGLI